MDALISAYHPALLATAILCLAVVVQSFLAGYLGLSKGEEIPGAPLKGDHSKLSFRAIRTYGNSAESLPMFLGAVFLAILVGVKPSAVNWLAGLHVAFRMLFWVIYYSGVGKVSAGPRSFAYAAGWLMNLILAGMTVLALL